jgi:hypothetical protein
MSSQRFARYFKSLAERVDVSKYQKGRGQMLLLNVWQTQFLHALICHCNIFRPPPSKKRKETQRKNRKEIRPKNQSHLDLPNPAK